MLYRNCILGLAVLLGALSSPMPAADPPRKNVEELEKEIAKLKAQLQQLGCG